MLTVRELFLKMSHLVGTFPECLDQEVKVEVFYPHPDRGRDVVEELELTCYAFTGLRLFHEKKREE
jgi:hypothetical protein